MNAYAFSKALLLIPFVAFIYVAGVWFSVRAMYLEISREAAFRAKIGSGWRAEYEKQYGSIADYRIKIVGTVVGLSVLSYLIARELGLVGSKRNKGRRAWSPARISDGPRVSPRFSRQEKDARYRRTGSVGICLGVAGLFAGIFVFARRVGFDAPIRGGYPAGLALSLFLGGYAAIIGGAYYWVKAKGWNDAVVAIALMPFGVLFVPYVRLLYVYIPWLLPFTMTMMSMILVAVVFVLPDRSGISRQGFWRRRK